jgi:NAD(P)-dependent dehydrogenase (short-subunit alcohol dehydrogenase family)
MNLSGKVALITGGARMGEAVAKALGSLGCQIILTYRSSKSSAEASAASLKAQGVAVATLPCDVSNPDSIQQLIQLIEKQFKRLDIVVNLASMYERTAAAKTPAESWDVHLTTNSRSAYLLTLAAAPLLKKSDRGRVIHISDWTSASGRPRYPEYSAYYTSKAAIKAVTEALALELAPLILVNAIAPGPMLPPKGLTPEEDLAVRQATPLGRWGGAEEIAKAVLFLVETDFMTGETLRVDGGRHLS